MKKLNLLLISICLFTTSLLAQSLDGVRIYINPGHGGYDSDDRNIVIPPFKQGDSEGFWESKSNLQKGLMLKDMLDETGATTFISRVENRTIDDLPLTQIVRAANEANADFMISIHSNAGNGVANHVLMLYAGVDVGDTHTYITPTPHSETSRLISTEIAKNLYSNACNSWSANYTVRGDKTFGRTAMGWSDGYGVLRGLTVPGVISEGSMHDYIPETYRLMNMDYKWLEAWHFMKSFLTYFKSATLPTGNIAGSLRDKFRLNEANYYKLPNSQDIFLPINGATITLNPGNLSYTTDNLNNGFFLFKNLNPGTYTLTIEHSDYHTETATVEVEANKVTYANLRPNLVRNTPPQVVDYAPKTEDETTPVLTSSVIHFRFNWDINTESARTAFSITPEVSGQFVFKESNFVMEFIPNAPLDISTIYTVTLDKSLSHHDGLSMEDDFSFSFLTANRNKLELLASYPQTNDEHIHFQAPTFTLLFDKQLVTAELIQGLQVYAADGRQLTKNIRSLKHNTYPEPLGSTAFTMGENLVPGESYVLKIPKGVKDIDGVFLTDTLEIPFKASDERVTNKTLLLDFEANGLMQADKDASEMLTSSSVARNSTKLFGSYSYNLKYQFSNMEGGEAVFKFTDSDMVIQGDSLVSLHVLGDLSSNELLLILRSATGFEEVSLGLLDFSGWKYLEMHPGSGLQLGENYTIEGLKVVQKESPINASGSLFIDNLLVTTHIVNSVDVNRATKLQVYPNPAADYVSVSHPQGETIESIQIFSLDGKHIYQGNSPQVDLQAFAKGNYLLKAKLKSGELSTILFIRKKD